MNFGRCYECFRPKEICFCNSIPTIDNRTEVLILQHRREHFHRFNTARIVQKALRNSQLLAGRTDNLVSRLQLKPRAGILYPGPTAIPLADLPLEQHPEQLVILDGTWHQTKTLLRDIPALQSLPRYRLTPAAPSRYRIRQPPNALSLSTVEATVAALRLLEPETLGFDRLLQAFDTMVDRQLAHLGAAGGSRFQTRGSRTLHNTPLALKGNMKNIVVAYGEATPGERGGGPAAGPPVCWVARRLGDGADFSCTLIPSQPLSDAILAHLELARTDFDAALSLPEARRRWVDFQRPGDVVTVIQPGTAKLFSYLSSGDARCLVLKSVAVKTVAEALQTLPTEPAFSFAASQTLGRATKRLAIAIQLVLHLNALVNDWQRAADDLKQ